MSRECRHPWKGCARQQTIYKKQVIHTPDVLRPRTEKDSIRTLLISGYGQPTVTQLLTGIVHWLKHNFHYNIILLASYTRDSPLYEPYVWTFLREKSNEKAMYIALRVL
jgi:hypothetical protein